MFIKMKIKTIVRKIKELSPEQREGEARVIEALYRLAQLKNTPKPTIKT